LGVAPGLLWSPIMRLAWLLVVAGACALDATPPPPPVDSAPPPPAVPAIGDTCYADADCAGGARPMECIEKAAQIVPIIPPVCTVGCTDDVQCTPEAIGQTGWRCATTGNPPACVPASWL